MDFLKKDWAGTKVNHRDLDSSLIFRNFLLSLEKEIHILRIEENKEKQNKRSHTKRTKKCFPQPNEKDKNCIRKLLALFSGVEAFFFLPHFKWVELTTLSTLDTVLISSLKNVLSVSGSNQIWILRAIWQNQQMLLILTICNCELIFF